VARWLLVASPILALAINCAFYLLLRRALAWRIGMSILGGLCFGLAAIVGFVVDSLDYANVAFAELMICQFGTYLTLSFCFWTFLNLNITSLRIRVIRELLQAGGAIAVVELLASYSDAERLQRRLARLMNGRQIELVDGNWRLRSSLILIIARCIDVNRTIMGLGGG
jgi:hypothetical protein